MNNWALYCKTNFRIITTNYSIVRFFSQFLRGLYIGRICTYRNDPKFSDRQVWANSVDQDQTAPEQSDQGLYCLPFCLHLVNSHEILSPETNPAIHRSVLQFVNDKGEELLRSNVWIMTSAVTTYATFNFLMM